MGVKIKKNNKSISIYKNTKLKKINVVTKPYPGFPTDLQAQLMVLMTQAKVYQKYQKTFLKIGLCMYLS